MSDLQLDTAQLSLLFPFHFLVDASLCVTFASVRLQELLPDVQVGQPLLHALEMTRPRMAVRFESLATQRHVSCVFQSRRTGLVLRGQVLPVAHGTRLLFVGSPQVDDVAELGALGLKLADFAPHDARLDLLIMTAGKQAALQDAYDLANRLRELRDREATRARALAGEIVQQERVASLGRVVAGVAHEINTPLGIAVTAASLVDEAVGTLGRLFADNQLKKSDLARLLTAAADAVSTLQVNIRRSAELIRQFKEVAVDRAGAGVRTIALGRYVDDTVASLRPMLKGTRVEVVVDKRALEPDGDLSVTLQPGILSQILTNLINNAMVHGFVPGQAGLVTVAVGRDGDWATLDVRDDGKGMDAHAAEHAFEPFFTTRLGQGGSGLGLFVVHNAVVDGLHGTITLTTQPGAGVHYAIRWPTQRTGASHGP